MKSYKKWVLVITLMTIAGCKVKSDDLAPSSKPIVYNWGQMAFTVNDGGVRKTFAVQVERVVLGEQRFVRVRSEQGAGADCRASITVLNANSATVQEEFPKMKWVIAEKGESEKTGPCVLPTALATEIEADDFQSLIHSEHHFLESMSQYRLTEEVLRRNRDIPGIQEINLGSRSILIMPSRSKDFEPPQDIGVILDIRTRHFVATALPARWIVDQASDNSIQIIRAPSYVPLPIHRDAVDFKLKQQQHDLACAFVYPNRDRKLSAQDEDKLLTEAIQRLKEKEGPALGCDNL